MTKKAAKQATKKGINSRQKGARGEREVCKVFAEWWGAEFSRTPLSGGWATAKTRDSVNAAGDLVCSDTRFPFTVECKFVEGWSFEQLLTAPKCNFYKWWDQAVGETPEGKMPLLVFTKSRAPWFFATFSENLLPLAVRGVTISTHIQERSVTIGLLADLLTPENMLYSTHLYTKRQP
jgi:hypothetical protein